MSISTYDAAMARVFADEGGYTNDPKDPGGATNWGITIFDARKYWKPDATPEDVKAMPKSVASDIYKKHYAAPLQYDALPAGVDYSVLDAGINSGVGRAVPWLAKAIGGVTVPNPSLTTLVSASNAVNDKASLIQRYWDIRLSFLQGLKNWSHFGGGWGRRCAQGEAAAVKMWLTFGANLPPPVVNKEMNKHADSAKNSAKKHGTGAATTGTATGVGTPSLDWSHMSLGGKIALCLAVAAAVVLVAYLVRKMVNHSQRATAYATA